MESSTCVPAIDGAGAGEVNAPDDALASFKIHQYKRQVQLNTKFFSSAQRSHLQSTHYSGNIGSQLEFVTTTPHSCDRRWRLTPSAPSSRSHNHQVRWCYYRLLQRANRQPDLGERAKSQRQQSSRSGPISRRRTELMPLQCPISRKISSTARRTSHQEQVRMRSFSKILTLTRPRRRHSSSTTPAATLGNGPNSRERQAPQQISKGLPGLHRRCRATSCTAKEAGDPQQSLE